MQILSITKDKEAIISFTPDELTEMSNALYSKYKDVETNERQKEFRADMLIARDMCWYGHLDTSCLEMVAIIKKIKQLEPIDL